MKIVRRKINLKSWLFNLSLIFSSIIVAVLLVEVTAIVTGFLIPQEFNDRHRWFYEFLEPDEKLGYKPKPNLSNFKLSWMEEAVSEIVNTDQYGFRNPNRDYHDSDLFIIGDSFGWGSWVEREKTFYGILENELRQPITNLSVGGYGIQQYKTVFKKYGARYKPKVVVLTIFANDLIPLTPTFENYYENIGWTQYKTFPWYKKTLSYRLISFVNDRNKKKAVEQEEFKKAKEGLTLYRLRGADENYLINHTYRDVEKIFSDIINLANEQKTILIVMLFPSKESTYIKDYMRLFPNSIDYLKNEEMGYERICRLASKKNIFCLNLTDDFRQASVKEKLYFDLDPHWNENGHRLAASKMVEVIQYSLDSNND